MFKCNDCNCVFEDPSEYREDTGGIDTRVGHIPYIEVFKSCPGCGSDDYNVAFECEHCGIYFPEYDLTYLGKGEYLCDQCLEQLNEEMWGAEADEQ